MVNQHTFSCKTTTLTRSLRPQHCNCCQTAPPPPPPPPHPPLSSCPRLSCSDCQVTLALLVRQLWNAFCVRYIAQALCHLHSLQALLQQKVPRVQVLAEVLGAEAALGRIQFVSGTHAIATALYSVLRPGDELLAVAGRHVCVCSTAGVLPVACTTCPACLPCLPACLPACLSVRPSACLSLCLSVRPSVCPSVRLSVCLPVCLPACLSACLSVCLSVCLSLSLCVVCFVLCVHPLHCVAAFPISCPELMSGSLKHLQPHK